MLTYSSGCVILSLVGGNVSPEWLERAGLEKVNIMKTYYGFNIANHSEEPAWFHTREAAARFNAACGGELGDIQTTQSPVPGDVMDSAQTPWIAGLIYQPGQSVESEVLAKLAKEEV